MALAARRWADALAAWALPAEVLSAAPESPWHFDPALFASSARVALASPLTPTHQAAREALLAGQERSLLDVGVGGGAASLPIVPPARRLVAVDQSAAMLELVARLAAERGVETYGVLGHWPEVAPVLSPVDVAVSAHVAYNAPNLDAFVVALTLAARRRAVLELTRTHPQSALNPLWRHFWGLERLEGPTAEDALQVVVEAVGVVPEVIRFQRRADAGGRSLPRPEIVASVRRRLCLPAERDPEIDRMLGPDPELSPPELVTLSWPGAALRS